MDTPRGGSFQIQTYAHTDNHTRTHAHVHIHTHTRTNSMTSPTTGPPLFYYLFRHELPVVWAFSGLILVVLANVRCLRVFLQVGIIKRV